MKIVYLMDQIYLHGGAEKILALKLNELASSPQNDVYLITTEQNDKPFVYPVDRSVKTFDLAINYLRGVSFFSPLNLFRTVKHIVKLRRLFRQIKPDIIVSVSQTPDQFFLPFLLPLVPKVKEFHTSGFVRKRDNESYFKHRLFKLYEKYNALVVLNNDEKRYYPFDNLKVIPNFIAKPNIVASQNKESVTNRIIAAGRIAPVKQFDHLIKAWSLIEKKHELWRVEIYGDGDDIQILNLNTLITDLGVQRLEIKKATSNLDCILANSKLFVMTSSTECYPMVLLESLSNGLPVVSYNCPHGPKNILTEDCGVLVPQNDILRLAEEISMLIENDGRRRRMCKAARLHFERFRQSVVMRQWLDLFYELKNTSSKTRS